MWRGVNRDTAGIPARRLVVVHSHRLAAVLLAFCFLSALAAQRAAAEESPAPALRTAGPVLLDEIHHKQLGNWARVWRTLYPAHQATFHLIPVSGRWTWILAPETYRMYHDTGCLLGPAA